MLHATIFVGSFANYKSCLLSCNCLCDALRRNGVRARASHQNITVLSHLNQCFEKNNGLYPWGTPYNDLHREALLERGTFFRLQVYKREGISQVEVYKRVGKSVILVFKRVLYKRVPFLPKWYIKG